MEHKYFRWEIKEHVAIVTLERPPVNAMSHAVYEEMADVFQTLPNEKGVRCIVLRSEGKGFIGGNDVNEIAGHTRENHTEYQDNIGRAVMSIVNNPLPVIAMVQGYAIGVGVVIAIACDMIVASEKAWFSMPEVSLGIVAGASFAMRGIPEKILYELSLTGVRMPAAELAKYGMINAVTAAEELDSKTMEMANAVAQQPPKATRLFKETMRYMYDHRSAELFRLETIFTDELIGTEERDECLRAFYEKRKAVFED